MTQDITDKTHVLVLRGNVKIYINLAEFEGIKNAISRGEDMFEVQGRLIMKQAILYLISAADQDIADKIKKGWWKCSKGNLHHPKYNDCSC
jgi:gamma-glutamylcyclotransferase (GGCT)/AIG2-like uncharacterized protein YtfP